MDVDEALRRIIMAAGIVLVLGGGALIFVEDPFPWGITVIIAPGLLALLFAALTVRGRLQGEIVETVMPDPERPPDNERPGDQVDRMLYEMTVLRQGVQENREHLEERMQRLGVAVVQDRRDCSPTEAERVLQSGEWTDNEDAAAFFQSETSAVDEAGFANALTGGRSDIDTFAYQFRVAVEELLRVGEIPAQELEYDSGPDSALGRILQRLGLGSGGSSDDEGDEGVQANWNTADSSIDSFDTDEPFEDVSLHRTNRWLGVTAFALFAVGAGVVTYNPGLMMAGTVGVAYTIYGRITAVPATDQLTVERELETEDAEPGEEVEVLVTVTNESGSMLPDLRMVDAVPDSFVVTDGCPRLHTALRSGASATFSYKVRVERGEHQWPLLCVARDFSGGAERTSLITPESKLTVTPSLKVTNKVPVRAQTTMYSGDINTRQGGPGLEFHSVRDYQNGDPMNRINWKKLAQTGELATIDFRQEKAATVTLLFDTRQSSYVAAEPGEPHAVDHSVHAASDVFGALYDQGNLVGVAAFDTVPCWFSAGAGSEHLEKARMLFAQHPALSPAPPERQNVEGQYIDPMTHVLRRLQSNSQIFMFTPLADDYAMEVASRLDSQGHLVTVMSPDVTTDRTVGQRLTRAERTARVRYLRQRGIRVIDWDTDEQLRLSIDRAKTRWA